MPSHQLCDSPTAQPSDDAADTSRPKDVDQQRKVKRVANRRPAPKSRARKLEQVSELEEQVEKLTKEIDMMAPKLEALKAKHAELLRVNRYYSNHLQQSVHPPPLPSAASAAIPSIYTSSSGGDQEFVHLATEFDVPNGFPGPIGASASVVFAMQNEQQDSQARLGQGNGVVGTVGQDYFQAQFADDETAADKAASPTRGLFFNDASQHQHLVSSLPMQEYGQYNQHESPDADLLVFSSHGAHTYAAQQMADEQAQFPPGAGVLPQLCLPDVNDQVFLPDSLLGNDLLQQDVQGVAHGEGDASMPSWMDIGGGHQHPDPEAHEPVPMMHAF